MQELAMPKPVYVRWKDCTSCDAWALPPEVEEIGCPIIETVGFLVVENDEFISVSVAWEPYCGKIAGTFSIPRAQIVGMEMISLPELKGKSCTTQ